jgi:hypothetical protein
MLGELISYAMLVWCGYWMVKGFIHLRPISGVIIPQTEINLATIYLGASVVLTYCYARRLRFAIAEYVTAMVETLYHARGVHAGIGEQEWPDVIAEGGQQGWRKTYFGVEGWAWKYVALVVLATFIITYKTGLTLYGVRGYAVACPIAFCVSCMFFIRLRINRRRREDQTGE